MSLNLYPIVQIYDVYYNNSLQYQLTIVSIVTRNSFPFSSFSLTTIEILRRFLVSVLRKNYLRKNGLLLIFIA